MNDQVLLVGHGQLKSWANGGANSDGNSYKNILSYRQAASGGAGFQWRNKFVDPTAQIPNGDSVVGGSRVILTQVSIHVTLGYILDANGVILGMTDALEMPVKWRIQLNGSTMPYYDECWPAQRLSVLASPTWLANQVPPTLIVGMLPVASTNITLFSRSLDFLLPRPILINQLQSFQIQMKIATATALDRACEYDVWAGGYEEPLP